MGQAAELSDWRFTERRELDDQLVPSALPPPRPRLRRRNTGAAKDLADKGTAVAPMTDIDRDLAEAMKNLAGADAACNTAHDLGANPGPDHPPPAQHPTGDKNSGM